MSIPSFELREYFHMVFLRHLAGRLSGRSYAVKGGACLRFFYRSPRFSQDMDLDIVSQVRVETLGKAVDGVLESRAFLAQLLHRGITHLKTAKAKQTGTTQRWKVALGLGPGEGATLPTKIEFSRRKERIAHSTGVPGRELLARHDMAPFVAQHYGAEEMAVQKILALASPSRHAVRDLFDLHHLCKVAGVSLSQAAGSRRSEDVQRAAEKCRRFTFGDFKEQVLPYLSAEMMDLFKDPGAFERLKGEVEESLRGERL